ncbi:MAG: hypothetical protein HOP07_15740 [Bacteriovoracaceae bacterium]|nr:hypothetical protein [Bacteriovoracaceae bacterium]
MDKNIKKKVVPLVHLGDNFLGVRSKILICDDAPQFKGILEFLGLCLIHEERHYKS